MFRLPRYSREKEVKASLWLLLTGLVLVLWGPGAHAQCPTRAVAVQGDVVGLPPDLRDVDVAVLLHTPAGDYSQTGTIDNGKFNVNVDFSTFKSWSPIRGHRCTNLPSYVDVTVKHKGKLIAHESLRFNESFEVTYRLMRKLKLDVSPENTSEGQR